jgi:CRP-like cAMP-binding protein
MPEKILALLKETCGARAMTFDAGQVIFRQGDVVRWLYVVTEGRVRLSRVLAKGTEIALARTLPDEILAEASVYSPRYHCDGIAEIRTDALRYSMRDVVRTMRENPEAAMAYGAYAAGQLMGLRTISEIRAIGRADERLLAWLQVQARGEPRTFDPQGPWSSVARQIGLTAESTYRALASLEKSGAIRRASGRVILKPEPL